MLLTGTFFSPLTHWQNVSLWGLFSSGETQKNRLGWGQVKREDGAGGLCRLVKNCWTLGVMWAGVLVNHASWNGQRSWKSLKKNALKSNAASHNSASWCTDPDGLLEHSSSRGTLYNKGPTHQQIILGGFGSSLVFCFSLEFVFCFILFSCW